MTNEQREAIEGVEEFNKKFDCGKYKKSIDTVLSLIKEQEEEIEKKDKIINEMISSFIDLGLGFEYCNNDDRCINDCDKCIKQYFAGLVEKE